MADLEDVIIEVAEQADRLELAARANQQQIDFVDTKVRSLTTHLDVPKHEKAWIATRTREDAVKELNLAGGGPGFTSAEVGTRARIAAMQGIVGELGGKVGTYEPLPNLPRGANLNDMANRIFVEGGKWGPRSLKDAKEMQQKLREAIQKRDWEAEGAAWEAEQAGFGGRKS